MMREIQAVAKFNSGRGGCLIECENSEFLEIPEALDFAVEIIKAATGNLSPELEQRIRALR